MKRWWIFPALVGILAIAGVTYWGFGESQAKKQLITSMNNRNQRAFYESIGHIQNVEAMLSKGIISNSPKQRMMIFSDVWQQAYAAQENLTQVPVSGPSLTRTSTFLTQTGDFAWSLSKKYARGLSIKPDELKKLNELHTQAGYLAMELLQIEKAASAGRLSWGDIKSETNRNLAKKVPIPSGLVKLDKNMESFPTLIYDGPFSEHITKAKPKGLTGSSVNVSRASDMARKFVETGSKIKYKVVRTENIKGTIPAFRIHLTPQNSGTPLVVVDISKTGGHVLSMLNTRTAGKTKLSAKNAIPVAQRFLINLKLENMEPTYMIEQHNIGIVIFEYKQDNVLIYPDLMKVKVGLDNGEIVGFEGTQFLVSHHKRKLAKPKVTEQQALSAVNPQLKITSKRLALIPLENLQEILVYEFRGDLGGDVFIVYVNALTGQEERILKVIDTKSGPVTM